MGKLLPILAPIVMAYLAKRLGGGAAAGAQQQGGIGDLLGSILGGMGGQQGRPQQGGQQQGGLGDMLNGPLGDLLGGLLGGGRRA
jgi:hypothetical protein